MSTVDAVSRKELSNWESPESNLSQLEQFRVLFHQPDVKVEEVWKQYSLLPKQGAYLIASHYGYDRCGWSITTKWQLVDHFDKVLRMENEMPKISAAIDSAIVAQMKLVALEKLFQILKDEKISGNEKARAFQVLKHKTPGLYDEIIRKIAVVYSKKSENPNMEPYTIARETHLENFQALSENVSFQVIEKMIRLYKEGHPQLDDIFFTR